MVPIDKSLDRLSKLSAKLNTETDDLNATIESLEKRLADARVGVSVWMDSVIDAKSSSYSVEADDGGPHQDVDREMFEIEGWDIGYAKVGDQWRIAAKQVHGSFRGFKGESVEWSDYEWNDAGPTIALVKAPRIVRIRAADKLDDLVDGLADQVEKYIGSIAKAKELATK